VDLPADNDSAGLQQYADTVIEAIGGHDDLVVVAHSLDGFTAPLDRWPDVPTRYLLFRDDRFFPAEFVRRVARERLGVVADEMDGSHCAYLSRPEELAARLNTYVA
jgi:hypothetical protein